MQYTAGTVTTAPGNQKIDGLNTAWTLAGITPGVDRFKVSTDNTPYDIVSITNDLELHLSVNFSGLLGTDVDYQIFRDFTATRGYGLINRGDKDWPDWSQLATNRIDSDIGLLLGKARQTFSTGIHALAPVTVYPDASVKPDGGLFMFRGVTAVDVSTIAFGAVIASGGLGTSVLTEFPILGVTPPLTWSYSAGVGIQLQVTINSFNLTGYKLSV